MYILLVLNVVLLFLAVRFLQCFSVMSVAWRVMHRKGGTKAIHSAPSNGLPSLA